MRPTTALATSLLTALVAFSLLPGCRDKETSKTKISAKGQRARAERCFGTGDYGCAMEALRRVLKIRPKDATLLNLFAMAARHRYYQSGDADFRDQELEALRKAIKLAPQEATIHINFGTTCWELGIRREAAESYRKALALHPEHPDASLMKDRINRSTKEVEDEQEE